MAKYFVRITKKASATNALNISKLESILKQKKIKILDKALHCDMFTVEYNGSMRRLQKDIGFSKDIVNIESDIQFQTQKR